MQQNKKPQYREFYPAGYQESLLPTPTGNTTPTTPAGSLPGTPAYYAPPQYVRDVPQYAESNPYAGGAYVPRQYEQDYGVVRSVPVATSQAQAAAQAAAQAQAQAAAAAAAYYRPKAPVGVMPQGKPMYYQGADMYNSYAAAVQGSSSTFNAPLPQQPMRHTVMSYHMSETLRQDLLRENQVIYGRLQPDDPRAQELPELVRQYHTFLPLDDAAKDGIPSSLIGRRTQVYKALSSVDNKPYALRRVDMFNGRVTDVMLATLEMWKALKHPNIAGFHEVFTSTDFAAKQQGPPQQPGSLVFVHQFFPNAVTLEQHHFSADPRGQYIAEATLWSYICQLVSAIRAVHQQGLACRCIDASKVLLTSRSRIRLGSVGVVDVVKFDTLKSIAESQYEDVIALGKLILCLACRSPSAVGNVQRSVEFVSKTYSSDLKNLILHLFDRQVPTIFDISTMISAHMYEELSQAYAYGDQLEDALSKQLENGRLFRLVSKLGFINERPEFAMDPQWSDTGDRYLLKLYRDYLFHSVNARGKPLVNYAHVVESLNKLDAGVPEHVALMSRDEVSILVVSYQDLKRCVEDSFSELSGKRGKRH